MLAALEAAEVEEELTDRELVAKVERLLEGALVEVMLVAITLEPVDELLSDVMMLLLDACWLLVVAELVDEIVEVKEPEDDGAAEDELEDVVVFCSTSTRAPQIPAPQAPLSFGGPTPLFR